MAIEMSDIEFFLSGGPTNSNPNNSIGGLPSSFLVLGSTNNLFSNLDSSQATSGRVDYRCFYVFNNSATDSLFDAEIFFKEQAAGGSSAELGIKTATEVQKITILGNVNAGSLVLRYRSSQFTVQWGTSFNDFRANLQTAINVHAPGVVVTTETQGSNGRIFRISFEGASNNRSHPLLELITNSLSTLVFRPSGSPDNPVASIARISEGSPVNSVAPSISVDTVAPAGVLFYNATESSKIQIGTLRPSDSIPIWIKRTTPAGADYLERDYFKFKITGRPF